MALVARGGDIAIGKHRIDGNTKWNIAILTGNGTVFSEGIGIAKQFSITNGNLGKGMIIQASSKVTAEGLGMARLADLAVCFCDGRNDTIITSAGTVSAI